MRVPFLRLTISEIGPRRWRLSFWGGPLAWGNARATPQVKGPPQKLKRQRRGPISEIVKRRNGTRIQRFGIARPVTQPVGLGWYVRRLWRSPQFAGAPAVP